MSASSPAIKRIMQELKDMRKNPSDCIIASPLDDNLFEWHFTVRGADKTEFEGGKYHGKFILPAQYPFKAPDIIMLTKSGRFEIGKKICLNFTGYHHELWRPAWTIRTMLTALRAFMETPAKGVGAISVDKQQRKKYAKLSINYKCTKCGVATKDIQFPKIQKNTKKDDNIDINDNNNDNNNDDIEEIMDKHESNGNIENNDDDNNNNGDNGDINDNDTNNEEEIIDNEEAELMEELMEELNLDNNNNENSMNTVNISTSTAPSTTKDKLLDSVTVFLVIIIAAILIKKFAFKFMEQL